MCYSGDAFPSKLPASASGGGFLFSIPGRDRLMRTRIVLWILSLAFVLAAVPAQAQYAVRGSSNRATGETYRFEIGGYFWNPTPEIAIASESIPGIIGDKIDFIADLGLEKKRFTQLKA